MDLRGFLCVLLDFSNKMIENREFLPIIWTPPVVYQLNSHLLCQSVILLDGRLRIA